MWFSTLEFIYVNGKPGGGYISAHDFWNHWNLSQYILVFGYHRNYFIVKSPTLINYNSRNKYLPFIKPSWVQSTSTFIGNEEKFVL